MTKGKKHDPENNLGEYGHYKEIHLSQRDARVFFEAIENPPKANQKLIDAIAMYRKAILVMEP